MRIVVLGGTGQIGQPLLKELARGPMPVEVVGTSRNEPPSAPDSHRIQWLRFDPFTDDWSQLGKVDVLVNAIGIIRERGSMTFEKVHLELTRTMLAQRTALGNPRLVQISALGADPNHEVDFLRTKGQADALLLAAPNTAVIRPSIVCTPDTMLAQKIRTLRQMARLMFGKLFVPKGFLNTRIQPILGEDLAQLLATVCPNPQYTDIIEAAGPVAFPFQHLLDLLGESSDRALRPIEMPKEIMDSFVKHFVSVWFPGMINYDQFRLLFTDNVSDQNDFQRIVGHAPRETTAFWQSEFARAVTPLPSSPATESLDVSSRFLPESQ